MPGVLASDQKLEVIEDRARTHQGLPVHILSAAPGAKVEERAPVNPNRAPSLRKVGEEGSARHRLEKREK